MITILEAIKNKPNQYFGKGVSEIEIELAERDLNLCFSKEYKTYLLQYGVISYDNHELTGLCKSERLNVVYVTIEERKFNPQIISDMYAIEQTNIDGIVIWQSSTGEIYQTAPGTKPIKICDSLSEYISLD